MTKQYFERVKRIPIHNMTEFQDVVMGMAKAEPRPVHIQGIGDFNEYAEYDELKNEPEFWQEKKIAIVNTRSNELAQIVSPSYKILPHGEFFAAVEDKLESVGVGNNFQGYVLEFDEGSAYTARFIFPDVLIEEPKKGMNVAVGCEFSNSHNAMYAAKGGAFYLRISCTNQMVLRNIIPECVFSRTHVAQSSTQLMEIVDEKMDEFMIALVDSGAMFQKVMEEAMDTDITYTSPLQLETALEDLIGVKKRAEEIAEIAHHKAIQHGNKFTLSSWDAYNSISDYVTHTPMPPAIFDQILVKAEKKVLMEPLKIPVKIPTA